MIHAGVKLYRLVKATDGTWSLAEIGAMANARSRSFVFDQKLYLLDGATYQVYDGETLSAVADNATVPTIIISRRPTGGGQVYEGLNLLGKKWTESFLNGGRHGVPADHQGTERRSRDGKGAGRGG